MYTIGKFAKMFNLSRSTLKNFKLVHYAFEKTAPDLHRKLLKYIGFSEDEIVEFIKKIK